MKMEAWKHGDLLARRKIIHQGFVLREMWGPCFFNYSDSNGNIAVTYPDGSMEMISQSQVGTELRWPT